MATALHDHDTLPPAHLDSDAVKFYEVVDGQIVENPPMGARESELASFLLELMGPPARLNRLGRVVTEMLFMIDHVRILKRRPDVAFVSNNRWPLKRRVPARESWHVVPDLAIEVVSKTNSANTIARKIDEYFDAGVVLMWVIYPALSKIYVYDSPTHVRILQIGDELDGGAVLPGFSVPLSALFGRKKKTKRQPKAE